MAYCNIDQLSPCNMYVAWIDVMGTKSIMSVDPRKSSCFVLKMYEIIEERKNLDTDIHFFPMNDGIYIASEDRNKLLNFLSSYMYDLKKVASGQDNPNKSNTDFKMEYSFIVRGAIGYGQVYFDSGIKSCSRNFVNTGSLVDRIILGMPIIQANEAERKAPPFGIYIHESARAIFEKNSISLSDVFWRWWNFIPNMEDGEKATIAKETSDFVSNYFAACEKSPYEYMLQREKIEEYRSIALAYFHHDNIE